MNAPTGPQRQAPAHALPIAPARCPLCGDANRCAISQGHPPRACWCMSVQVPAALLEELPRAAVGRACICAACIAAWNQRGVIRRFAR